jgi:hypothetical protein
MGFNFGAFVGGMSRQIVADIEREEEYALKMKGIAETEAMRQRAARAGERRKKQAALEASIGALKFLGYSDQAAAAIARQGEYAVGLAQNIGEQAMKKGVDVNTIYSMPNIDSDVEVGSKDMTETVNAAKADAPKISTGVMGLDTEAYQNLFAEPDKVESSYSARLAVISQKLARNPNRADADALKTEQTQLLSDLRTMKEAEREEKGTVTPSFDLSSITANVKEVRLGALERYGFEIGTDEKIENLTEGNMHRADLAELVVADQLNTRNKGIEDPNMQLTIQGIRDTAVRNLNEYGWNTYYNKKDRLETADSNETFVTSYKQGKYRQGQVVVVDKKVILYTGIPDYRTGQPYIILTPDRDM